MRKAFRRCSGGEETLDIECLDQVLSHLGYIMAPDDFLKTMASNVTHLSSFDFNELVAFLLDYAASEKDLLDAAFSKRAHKTSSGATRISVQELPLVMKDLQISLLHNSSVEFLQTAGLSSRSLLDSDDVARVLAAYRMCEGFTAKELAKAQEVFDTAAADAENKHLTVADLPNALLDLFGVHCIKHLRELASDNANAIKAPGTQTSVVQFHEFLIWARRLQNEQLLKLVEKFEGVDRDKDGAISFEELMSLMKQEGFTLSPTAADEFLRDSCLLSKRDALFSFDDVVMYLLTSRTSDGFSQQDLEELTAAYNKFDTESEGEITTLQVLDLLRYLGYQVQVEDVERYANEVDFNGNGTMDVNEYLRLMRLHHEDDIYNVHQVFYRSVSSSNSGCLPFASLHDALQKSKACPDHCDVFEELCREESLDPNMDGVSFDEFKILAGKSHQLVKRAQRKKANFSDSDVAVLQGVFKKYDVQGLGVLEKNQIMRLFLECGILHTSDGGQHLVTDMLDKARRAALEAEISAEDVGEFGSFSVTFGVMLQAWRGIARENECKKIARLNEARVASAFSVSEVEDFQNVFSNCIKSRFAETGDHDEGHGGRGRWRSKDSRQSTESMSRQVSQASKQATSRSGSKQLREGASLEAILSIIDDRLTFEELMYLLHTMHVGLSPAHSLTLQAQLQKLTGDTHGSVDIANFLYLMRWMLATNFAHLNDRTASVANSMTRQTPGSSQKKGFEIEEEARSISKESHRKRQLHARRVST